MAISINIYYTGEADNAKLFAEEMISNGIVEEIRKEDGNLRYDYFLPLYNDKTLLLIDSWENQLSLDKHHASPMMQKIIELREKYNLHMKIERYVSDESGIPDNDKKFIKN